MKRITILLIFLLSGIFHLEAQVLISNNNAIDYSTPKTYEIGGITVSGIRNFDIGTIILYSGLKTGEKIKIPGDDITRAIRNLWEKNLFGDVQIIAADIREEKIYLNIKLEELPRLSRYTFDGITKSEADDLRDELNLVRGTQVNENLLTNTKQTINAYFLDKGYFKVSMDFNQKPDTLIPNSVMLYLNIKKGEKIKIREIVFDGSTTIKTGKLKRAMKGTKEKHWYRLFARSKFITKAYEEDKKKIIEKYNEFGHRNATIVDDSVIFNSDNTLSIQLKIDEGNPFYFRNVRWVGNTKYSSSELDKILGINSGDIYNQSVLDSRLMMNQNGRDISSLYLDDGYLFFNVTPVEVAVENDSIDFEMRIYEGKQARINRITLIGNTKTNDHVVMREIRTKPGDLFRRSDIIRTQRELSTLGYFDPEQMNVTPIPNQQDGTVDIEYTVAEKPSDQVELSGGWGGFGIVGTLGLSFTNFSLKKIFKGPYNPLPAGDGQKLSIRAQSSGRTFQSYNFSFTEPWLGGKKPNSFSISAYTSVQSNGIKKGVLNENGESLRQSLVITGVSVGLGKRLKWPDDWFSTYMELSYQNYDLNNFNAFQSVFALNNGNSNIIAGRFVFSRNSISQPIYPRYGSNLSFTVKATLPFSAFDGVSDYSALSDQQKYKWIEYHKWKFTSSWFTELAPKLVLNARAGFGFLGHYNNQIGPSPFERFYLGGSALSGFSLDGREIIGLRGYDDGSLSPATGALFISKYTTELRYPLSLNPSATIFGLAFAEAGNTWQDFKNYNPFQVNRSAGIGMRIFLPVFGMLGLDYGWRFDDVPNIPGMTRGQFHFTIGMNLGEL